MKNKYILLDEVKKKKQESITLTLTEISGPPRNSLEITKIKIIKGKKTIDKQYDLGCSLEFAMSNVVILGHHFSHCSSLFL